MLQKKAYLRFLSLCMVLFIGTLVLFNPYSFQATGGASSSSRDTSADRDKYDELNQKLKETREEIAALDKKIKSSKNTAADAQKRQKYYEQEAAILAEQIVVQQAVITQQEADITLKQEEIFQKQKELDENDRLFRQRLVAIYKMNDTSALALLLNVDSFADFLTISKNLQTVSKHDTDLLELLETQRAALQTAEDEMQAMLAQLETEKAEMDATLTAYQNSIQQAKVEYNTAVNTIAASEAELEAKQKEYDAALSELEEVWKNLGSSRPQYIGGALQWPTQGYNGDSYITSHFGWRTLFGKQNFHGGMDISGGGIYGKPVLASNGGDVVQVVSGSNVGYGNYVIIDHGNGIKTLYGHCSSVAVSKGQYVAQGQVIAYVGSTGNSTGPHLHFELRVNNVKTNPYPYLTGQKSFD